MFVLFRFVFVCEFGKLLNSTMGPGVRAAPTVFPSLHQSHQLHTACYRTTTSRHGFFLTPCAVSFCPIGLFERGSHRPSEIKPTNVEPGPFETISRDSRSECPSTPQEKPGPTLLLGMNDRIQPLADNKRGAFTFCGSYLRL